MSGGNESAINPKKPVTFTMDSYGAVLSKRKVNAEKFPEMISSPLEAQVLKDKNPKSKKKNLKGVVSGEAAILQDADGSPKGKIMKT